MDTLLMVAVVLIALAICVQAGVLLAMYMMSRRLTDKVNGFIDESRTLVGPLQTVASNLKETSAELAEMGKIGRDQAHRVASTVNETRESIRLEVEDIRDRIVGTVDDAKHTLLRPVRQCAAVAQGVAEGVRTLFRGKASECADTVKQETPAA